MDDGICRTSDGRYRAYVQIQDGVEFCGEYATGAEAAQAWRDGHAAYNHADRSGQRAPYLEERPAKQPEGMASAPLPEPRFVTEIRRIIKAYDDFREKFPDLALDVCAEMERTRSTRIEEILMKDDFLRRAGPGKKPQGRKKTPRRRSQ